MIAFMEDALADNKKGPIENPEERVILEDILELPEGVDNKPH